MQAIEQRIGNPVTRQEFIDKAWEAAATARSKGAAISVPIAVAQAALETNFGDSELATRHNNLFGIKGEYRGESAVYQTKEQDRDGNVYITEAKFKAYPDWEHCFQDYADIIARLPWYQDAENAANIPRDYLMGLVPIRADDGSVEEPGWATDHKYFEKVWNIAESYYLLQRTESSKDEELALVQLYDGDRRYDFVPMKHTLGVTNDGKPKLMVRIKPTTFWQRLGFLFGRNI